MAMPALAKESGCSMRSPLTNTTILFIARDGYPAPKMPKAERSRSVILLLHRMNCAVSQDRSITAASVFERGYQILLRRVNIPEP